MSCEAFNGDTTAPLCGAYGRGLNEVAEVVKKFASVVVSRRLSGLWIAGEDEPEKDKESASG